MATTYTPAEHLQKWCPALYGLGSGVYTYWLDDSSNQLNTGVSYKDWGSQNIRNLAVALLAAHNWQIGPGAAVDVGGTSSTALPGAVTAQTTGAESVSYGNPGVSSVKISSSDLSLTSTVYGRKFLELRKTRPWFGMQIL